MPPPLAADQLPPPRWAVGRVVEAWVEGHLVAARIVCARRAAHGWPVAVYRLEVAPGAPWVAVHDRAIVRYVDKEAV